MKDFGLKCSLVISFLLVHCCTSNIQVYRYVDDSDNLISSDEYYGSFPASFFTTTASTQISTTYKPLQPTRYPVYVRPDSILPEIPSENKYKLVSQRPELFIQPTTAAPTTTTRKTKPTTERSTTSTTQGYVESGDEMQLEMPSAEVFLTRGNTEETIPLGLSGGAYIRDIIISKQMVRNGSEFNHVVLLCNSSYPIEWLYEGVGAPMLYTTQIRTFGNFYDPSTYGHSSIVVLVQERLDERQTGTFKCASVQNPELYTGFHLYFKGEFGFPSLQNVLIQPESNEKTVLLPCPTTDPGATVGLYKVASLGVNSRNLTLRGSFAYDPRKGFSVKLSDMSHPFGTYMCKFNDQESYWKIEVVQPKYEEVQVNPNATVIRMDNLADHNFKCKAKEPIQMMLPNTVDFGRVDYTENFNDEFPYQAILTITPNVPLFSIANYFKINCQSRKTRRILHSWEYRAEEIKVSYDEHHKRLVCCSKSGLTPIHEMAKCETVTDCNIKKRCFSSGRCDYAFPPKFVDAPKGCTAIEFMDDFPSHVMRCSVGHISDIMLVTSNIANNNLIIYNGTVPATEEILKIVTLKPQQNNRVEVRCVASIFYFSTNIVFAYERKDGTLAFADETAIENVNSYGPTLKAILEPGTKRIFCFAPLTRSSEWRNASIEIVTPDGSSFSQRSKSGIVEPHFHQQLNSDQYADEDASNEGEDFQQKVVTSIKTSTSVTTFLRKKRGQLIKVLQDD